MSVDETQVELQVVPVIINRPGAFPLRQQEEEEFSPSVCWAGSLLISALVMIIFCGSLAYECSSHEIDLRSPVEGVALFVSAGIAYGLQLLLALLVLRKSEIRIMHCWKITLTRFELWIMLAIIQSLLLLHFVLYVVLTATSMPSYNSIFFFVPGVIASVGILICCILTSITAHQYGPRAVDPDTEPLGVAPQNNNPPNYLPINRAVVG